MKNNKYNQDKNSGIEALKETFKNDKVTLNGVNPNANDSFENAHQAFWYLNTKGELKIILPESNLDHRHNQTGIFYFYF